MERVARRGEVGSCGFEEQRFAARHDPTGPEHEDEQYFQNRIQQPSTRAGDGRRCAAVSPGAKRADPDTVKSTFLSAEHGTGYGFIYGKDGSVILDARTVRALRDGFRGALRPDLALTL